MTGLSASTSSLCYVGCYTQFRDRSQDDGIYLCRLDTVTGALTRVGSAGGVTNPSFLALHPTRPLLYSVSETRDGKVCAFALDETDGSLRLINEQSSHGDDPCHLIVDRSGRFVLVANYSSGTIAFLPIREDGGLAPASETIQHVGSGPNPRRQTHAYAHSIWQDPTGDFVLSCDLGCDRVFVYRFDAGRGKLVPNDPPTGVIHPGAGPRHLDFHPNGRFVYVIDEIDSTLAVLSWDGVSGALTEIQSVSTLPAGFAGVNSCADVHVAPSGRFVYGSNRGHDSIAAFAIDEATGRVEPIGHQSTLGRTPRNFALDPSGSLLLAANQDSGGIVSFHVDAGTGRLTPSGQAVDVLLPVCVRFAGAR